MKRLLIPGVLTAFALLVGGGSAAVQANTLYVAVGGSDSASCSSTAPCASMGRAYNIAQSGDTVVVRAGSYPSSASTFSNVSGSKTLTYQAEGTVVLAGLGVERDNLTFDGFDVNRQGTKNIGVFAAGNNLVFRNMRVGNLKDEKGAMVGGTNVTFDNVYFHDVLVTDPNVHNECVWSSGPNLTVRNSRFENCATMDLFITRGTWYGQPMYGGVTLENNYFGTSRMLNGSCCHYYGLGINGGQVITELRDWTVRNNHFEQAVGGSDVPPTGNSVFCGNTGEGPGSWEVACAGAPPPPPPPPPPEEPPPPPPPPACDAACEQAYKDQIASLQADNAALEDDVQELSRALSDEKARTGALEAKLDAIRDIVG